MEHRSQEPIAKQCQEIEATIAKQGTIVRMEKPGGKGKKVLTFPNTCSMSWAICHLLVASSKLEQAER